ncbi:KTSC domain-containing protein [Falsiroseomonas sp. CW058]|uniref:KTSC domain-containing protein n=1 Tax=Falsiroseomonas sp. CW058 TaxID=3388664 RepID=UPI003D3244E7
MRRAGLPAFLPLLLLAAPAAAETCSRSTFASQDYAFARWCGDPATTGTLQVARRDGRSTSFLDVPADTYRELIRTHAVQRFLATEVEPRFRRAGVPALREAPARDDTPPQRSAAVARPAREELPLPPVPPRR